MNRECNDVVTGTPTSAVRSGSMAFVAVALAICFGGSSACNDTGAHARDAEVDARPLTADASDQIDATLTDATSSSNDGDAAESDARPPFPSTPQRGQPVSYNAATVTDLTYSLTGYIQTITPGTPGSGQSTMVVLSDTGFNSAAGHCVTIAGTGTALDGSHGGSCATGYQVIRAAPGNPTTLSFATTATASYSNSITNDSIALIVKTNDGAILSFYRHGSSDTSDPGITVLRRSTDHGATWTPFSGPSHVRQADGTWVTGLGGRCAGTIDDAPGCLFADNSGSCNSRTENVDLRNLSGGIAPDGNVVLFWTTWCWKNPFEFFGIYYSTSADDGATWSAPTQMINVPAAESTFGWCGTYGGLMSLPAGLAIGILGYPSTQNFCQVPGHGYLVLSHDNGRTWGVSTTDDFIRVSDNAHTSLPTNENTYAYVGNSQIIGFGRDMCPKGNCPLLFHYSADLGKSWKITSTNFAGSPVSNGSDSGQTPIAVNMVSPWLFDANLPGGQLTLLFAERQLDSPGGTVDALRAISFPPAAAIANPRGFGATQTLWSSKYNDWGYPSVVQTSPFEIFIQWDSEQYPAGPLNLFTMTAAYGCSGPGPECRL
jgi:hypothetical protein